MTSDLDRRLREVMSEVFSIPPSEVGPELSMRTFEGWDSLSHLNLVIALEEAFELRLDADDVTKMSSYTDLRAILACRLGAAPETLATESATVPVATEVPLQISEATPSHDPFAGISHLDANFRTLVQTDTVFGQLASDSKILLYRAHGAQIGENVTIGEGSRIIARQLIIGDDVTIGNGTVVEAKRVYLGSSVRIGYNCSFVAHDIRIGGATVITNRVRVDVAGRGQTRAARLTVGRQCGIFDEVSINVAQPVTLEDQVAVGPRATIFTHSYWQSVMDGYSALCKEVYLKERCWVGAGAQLLPGSTVGAGSIVMGNSVVTGDILPDTLVGGVPARPIRSGLCSVLSKDEKENLVLEIVERFLAYLRDSRCEVESRVGSNGPVYMVVFPNGTSEMLVYGASNNDAVSMGFNIEDIGGVVLDLARNVATGPETLLSYELRNFLRRYGIRLAPINWHYDWRKGIHNLE